MIRRWRHRRKVDRWLRKQGRRSELRLLAVRELIEPLRKMDGDPLIPVRLVHEAIMTGRVPDLGPKKVGQAEKTP